MLFRVVKSDVVRGSAGIENSAEPLCPLEKYSCIVKKYNCLWAFYPRSGINVTLTIASLLLYSIVAYFILCFSPKIIRVFMSFYLYCKVVIFQTLSPCSFSSCRDSLCKFIAFTVHNDTCTLDHSNGLLQFFTHRQFRKELGIQPCGTTVWNVQMDESNVFDCGLLFWLCL